MTSREKLWLTVGLAAFVILHLWGARLIGTASMQNVAPASFAATGD
jgi:hypothetical protein